MPAIITDDHRKNNANAFVTNVNTLATDYHSRKQVDIILE